MPMTFVTELVATGSEMRLNMPHGWSGQWQIQQRDGKPMGHLHHYGYRAFPSCIVLPAMRRGTEFQVLTTDKD